MLVSFDASRLFRSMSFSSNDLEVLGWGLYCDCCVGTLCQCINSSRACVNTVLRRVATKSYLAVHSTLRPRYVVFGALHTCMRWASSQSQAFSCTSLSISIKRMKQCAAYWISLTSVSVLLKYRKQTRFVSTRTLSVCCGYRQPCSC